MLWRSKLRFKMRYAAEGTKLVSHPDDDTSMVGDLGDTAWLDRRSPRNVSQGWHPRFGAIHYDGMRRMLEYSSSPSAKAPFIDNLLPPPSPMARFQGEFRGPIRKRLKAARERHMAFIMIYAQQMMFET